MDRYWLTQSRRELEELLLLLPPDQQLATDGVDDMAIERREFAAWRLWGKGKSDD
jgi:hypothetical protein